MDKGKTWMRQYRLEMCKIRANIIIPVYDAPERHAMKTAGTFYTESQGFDAIRHNYIACFEASGTIIRHNVCQVELTGQVWPTKWMDK